MNKILPRKKLLELKEQEHTLFIEKRDKYFKDNPNSYLKYGDYIAEITDEELKEYENAYIKAIKKLNTDDIVR